MYIIYIIYKIIDTQSNVPVPVATSLFVVVTIGPPTAGHATPLNTFWMIRMIEDGEWSPLGFPPWSPFRVNT